MSSIKTPGVYVQEIAKFPPSVAQVETAIPAFIGYTEKAKLIANDDLLDKPKRISSLAEFESYYGGAAPIALGTIEVDSNLALQNVSTSGGDIYYLYNSLKMYFANGGGDCYIVSVGNYSTTGTKDHFLIGSNGNGGLKAVELEDEPTLLLFPDAVNLSATELSDIQNEALLQANKLQDRFVIMDIKNHASTDTGLAPVQLFRDGITNYFKYGAAYTPWLQTTLGPKVNYASIKSATSLVSGGGSTTLLALATNLTNSDTIQQIIQDLDAAVGYTEAFNDELLVLTPSAAGLLVNPAGAPHFSSLEKKFLALKAALYASPDADAARTAFEDLMEFFADIAVALNSLADADTSFNDNLDKAITQKIASTLANPYKLIVAIEDLLAALGTAPPAPYSVQYPDSSLGTISGNLGRWAIPVTSGSPTQNIFSDPITLPTSVANSITNEYNSTDDEYEIENFTVAFEYLDAEHVFSSILAAFIDLQASAANYEATYEQALQSIFPEYTKLLGQISQHLAKMPPSGAMAGLYAAVDRDRGVWKAPANVGVTLASGVTRVFTASELDALNVDVNAGKSVNAIRKLNGIGIRAMGGRTLAGNDNEWRYISVRRFFNMVEESVKKSTQWAVFEPNDANTWVKVQKMIENFLFTQWRAGALAGAKPEHAYYVSVGLNLTMTAEDILNGFMNVEIGMAVVRPAEFIVLKFSHKLQES